MLKLKRISGVYGMQVFTDNGDYFGDIEEGIIQENRLFGWKIRATKESFLAKSVGGAKGVIVPHQLVRAMGDIVLISGSVVPSFENGKEKNDMRDLA